MYDCIIIGAGAAGLQAAELLAEASLSYICLEADHKAGGRIKAHQG